MRQITATAAEILKSRTRGVWWVADLFYDGQRRAKDVPLADVSLDWDASRQVAGSGSLTVLWRDTFGRDLTPRDLYDWFAPFGAELQVDAMVVAGRFTERVPVGRFVISGVPPSRVPATALPTPAAAIKLDVKDVSYRVARNKFAFPTRPTSTSAWSEAQWLTSVPIVRNVADAAVPASVLYEGSRLDTLDDVFALMGAWPFVTAQGALTARPFAWGAPVDTVSAPGTVTSELRADNVYNRVVVEGKGTNDAIVRAVADVTDGPLRVANPNGSPGPYGVVPYSYSSDFVTTQEQAQRVARDTLARVSRLHGVTKSFTEPLNPAREVGDVLLLNGQRVRVTKVAMAGGATAVTAEVEQS